MNLPHAVSVVFLEEAPPPSGTPNQHPLRRQHPPHFHNLQLRKHLGRRSGKEHRHANPNVGKGQLTKVSSGMHHQPANLKHNSATLKMASKMDLRRARVGANAAGTNASDAIKNAVNKVLNLFKLNKIRPTDSASTTAINKTKEDPSHSMRRNTIPRNVGPLSS